MIRLPFSAEMMRLLPQYLLAMAGLALADPRDFGLPCSEVQCPTGWRNVEGSCLLFAGWEERRGREVCRQNRAEYLQCQWGGTVRLCLVRRETRCQCGRYNGSVLSEGGLRLGYPWQGTVQDQTCQHLTHLYTYNTIIVWCFNCFV